MAKYMFLLGCMDGSTWIQKKATFLNVFGFSSFLLHLLLQHFCSIPILMNLAMFQLLLGKTFYFSSVFYCFFTYQFKTYLKITFMSLFYIYSRLLRCSTARGSDSGLSLWGPTKVKACILLYSLMLQYKIQWSKNVLAHQDLNHGPLEPKASVQLMSYADPFNTKYFPEDHTKREYII